MPFEIDPTVDFAFKRLFGVEANKPLLIDLLNAILMPQPGSDVVDVELRDPFNLRDFEDDKLSVVDLKVRDQSGRRFIVEMQMIAFPELLIRFLYYWAENFCEPLKDGASYLDLQPTILIAFLCDPLFPQTQDYHLRFRLLDDRHGLLFTDHLEVHTIELSKLSGTPGENSAQLDRWAYFFSFAKGHDMAQFPEEMLEDPIFQQAFHELQKMAGNPEEREAYHKRLRNLREERTRMESSLRQGYAQGVSDERAAACRRQIRLLERVLRLPSTSDERLQAMSLAELEQSAEELAERCVAKADERN